MLSAIFLFRPVTRSVTFCVQAPTPSEKASMNRESENHPVRENSSILGAAESVETSEAASTTEFSLSKIAPVLRGRAALVTGAGVGIGRAIAEQFAAAGATVGIHFNRSRDDADLTLDSIVKQGGNGVLLQADLTNPLDAARLAEDFTRQVGRIDILVNNAGGPIQRTKMEECPLDLWHEVIATNLTSAFLVTKGAIPGLRASKAGSILNILTLSIQTGGANGAGPYAIAKGGLQVMTRTLAKELAPTIRVNSLMPGVIETRHHEAFTTAERMEQYRKETPLGRNGQAEEVAAAALFLCSPGASFINGACIDINGGRFLR